MIGVADSEHAQYRKSLTRMTDNLLSLYSKIHRNTQNYILNPQTKFGKNRVKCRFLARNTVWHVRKVIQGHRRCHGSTERMWFPITVL